jgi:hypothetical protein
MHSELEPKWARPLQLKAMQLNLTDIKPEDSEGMVTPSIFSPIVHGLGENPLTVIKHDLELMQDTISIDQFANPLSEIS